MLLFTALRSHCSSLVRIALVRGASQCSWYLTRSWIGDGRRFFADRTISRRLDVMPITIASIKYHEHATLPRKGSPAETTNRGGS